MGITYWVDVTDYDNIRIEYQNSRPIVAIIALDNLDELIKNLPDRGKSDIRAQLDGQDNPVGRRQGRAAPPRRARQVSLRVRGALPRGDDAEKFSLVESAHGVVSPSGIHATVSMGIGRDGGDFAENYHFASLAIEMALSRGGDQAVIKNRFTFEFFGGRGAEVEKRTKVRSRVMANALNEMIADSSQVFVMGHKHADLDAIGSAAGICCMARKNGKKYHIVVDPEKNAAKSLINMLREEPEYARRSSLPRRPYSALTGAACSSSWTPTGPNRSRTRTSCSHATAWAVIDHHRRAATYIENPVLTLYEPYASSVCELVVELLQEVVEQADILHCEGRGHDGRHSARHQELHHTHRRAHFRRGRVPAPRRSRHRGRQAPAPVGFCQHGGALYDTPERQDLPRQHRRVGDEVPAGPRGRRPGGRRAAQHLRC